MIPIDEHELTTDNMTKYCKNFIKNVVAKIGDSKQPLFGVTDPERVYYSDFGYTKNVDDKILPNWEEIQYQKEVEVNKAYIEALYNYIGSKVVFLDKYSIPELYQVKLRNHYTLGNPIDEYHSNPILDKKVYELEFPDGRVDEYSVTIIIDNLIKNCNDQGKDTGIQMLT